MARLPRNRGRPFYSQVEYPMHEMSIAQSIFEIVTDEIQKYDVTKVIAVNLKVGAMSAVVPASLKFCWQVLTENTPLEGAALNIEEVPVRARCRECGQEFEVKEYRFICDNCDSNSVETISGRELAVQDIEAE